MSSHLSIQIVLRNSFGFFEIKKKSNFSRKSVFSSKGYVLSEGFVCIPQQSKPSLLLR